jgi:hypothetical protein
VDSRIILRGDVTRDSRTGYQSGQGAQPRADVLSVNDGETLGSITERAYGANTPELRDRITRANGNLSGEIIAPR